MQKEGTVYLGEVNEEEIRNAEVKWLRNVQKKLNSQANYSQLGRDFVLHEDSNGVLRCKGRIANADLPHETKLVRDAHERVHHNRVEATLTQLRTRFWIVKRRQLAVQFVADMKVRVTRVPPQNDLHEFRLSQKPAFTYVRVDYAGPLYILMYKRCQDSQGFRRSVFSYSPAVLREQGIDGIRPPRRLAAQNADHIRRIVDQ